MVAVLTGLAVGAFSGCMGREAPGQATEDMQPAGKVAAMQDRAVSDTRSAPAKTGSTMPLVELPPRGPAPRTDESEFADPSVFTRRFLAEMTSLVRRGSPTSPEKLFEQAQRAKRCDVVPLADPGLKLSPEAIYAKAKSGVVVVGALMPTRNPKRFHAALATGFIIRGDGVTVTNYHVIEAFQNAKAIGVMTDDRRVFPVQVVLAGDEHNDVAVIKVEAEGLTALPLATSVPVGAPVYCLSHPSLDTDETETAFYAFTQGVVCGKFHVRLGCPKPVDVLAITAEYAKGSSGGPILNEHGAVVGVICQTRTLFYDGHETEPQLTWKFSRPVSSLRALLTAPATSKGS